MTNRTGVANVTGRPTPPVLAAPVAYDPTPEFQPLDPEPGAASEWVLNLDVAAAEFTLVPPGTYDAVLSRINAQYSQAGNPMLNCSYTILDPDGEWDGRRVFGRFMLAPENATWRLVGFLKSIGYKGTVDMRDLAENLIDTPVTLVLEHGKDQNGKPQVDIKRIAFRDPNVPTGDIPF